MRYHGDWRFFSRLLITLYKHAPDCTYFVFAQTNLLKIFEDVIFRRPRRETSFFVTSEAWHNLIAVVRLKQLLLFFFTIQLEFIYESWNLNLWLTLSFSLMLFLYYFASFHNQGHFHITLTLFLCHLNTNPLPFLEW